MRDVQNGPAHGYLPEKSVYQRGREFAENGFAEKFEQKEWFQIRNIAGDSKAMQPTLVTY